MNYDVTFQTQCYENDYEYILAENTLENRILNCNHDFKKRVLIINNVSDRKKVASLAEVIKKKNIIDEYYFAEDYIDTALKFFDIKKSSFNGGYYYARCHLVGAYLCTTTYLLHFNSDAYIPKPAQIDWINEGIQMMALNPTYTSVSPLWNDAYDGAKAESVDDLGDYFTSYNFSDNCYLVPVQLFKTKIYNEHNDTSGHYPEYAGESFEKRVYCYMRNRGLLRLIYKKVSYTHKDFPKKPVHPLIAKIRSVQKLANRISRKVKKKLGK